MAERKVSNQTIEEQERRLQIERNQAAIRLLDSWVDDESYPADEQNRALQELMRSIDEQRPAGSKLFEDMAE